MQYLYINTIIIYYSMYMYIYIIYYIVYKYTIVQYYNKYININIINIKYIF